MPLRIQILGLFQVSKMKEQLDVILSFYMAGGHRPAPGMVQLKDHAKDHAKIVPRIELLIDTNPFMYVRVTGVAGATASNNLVRIPEGHAYRGIFDSSKRAIKGIVEYDFLNNDITNVVEHEPFGSQHIFYPVTFPLAFFKYKFIYELPTSQEHHQAPWRSA